LESHRSSFAFTDTRVPGKVLLAPPSCARIERSEAQNYTVGPALAAHISFLRRARFRTAGRCYNLALASSVTKRSCDADSESRLGTHDGSDGRGPCRWSSPHEPRCTNGRRPAAGESGGFP